MSVFSQVMEKCGGNDTQLFTRKAFKLHICSLQKDVATLDILRDNPKYALKLERMSEEEAAYLETVTTTGFTAYLIAAQRAYNALMEEGEGVRIVVDSYHGKDGNIRFLQHTFIPPVPVANAISGAVASVE